ncbi:MAG: hypothetical protein KC503_41710 [Myxococcales bacterium]|nr:hypothetical protein [Myxococcales bacterium]
MNGKMLFAALAILLCCTPLACSKKAPPEAKAALTSALDALGQGNAAAFVAKVLPAQRASVRTLRQWPFFAAVKGYKIDDELSKGTDNGARFMTHVYFDAAQKVFTTLGFELKQAGGAWGIDLKETIRMQIAMNGAAAFNRYKFVRKR